MKELLTQELVKEFLHYNPDTGVFTWLHRDQNWFATYRSFRSWNAKNAGKQAGNVHKCTRGKKYVCIKVNGKTYKAHRLAFLYMTGSFPTDDVDHLSGDGTDNRWSIIREATKHQNGCNKKLPSNNTSGVMGVGLSSGRWQATIKVKQKNIYLGKFSDFFEAVCARKSAENKHGFHANHGSIRPL